jgi:iron complex outermembrane receptor protein
MEKVSGSVRYGGTLTEGWSYRAYAKYFERNETEIEATGMGANDAWNSAQGGFRMDYDVSTKGVLTLQGDFYSAEFDQLMNPMGSMKGANLLAEWNHSLAENSQLLLSSYFDYTNRRVPNVFGDDRRIGSVELEHHLDWAIHHLSWGAGIRFGSTDQINSDQLAFLPAQTSGSLLSAFVQDMLLLGGGVALTLGTKFTKGSRSDFQIQPRVSIGWTASQRDFLWASVSRALRTPSRLDQNLYAPGVPPYVLVGNPDFIPEKLVAFETGYRNQISRNLLVDLALFYNLYDDVRSVEPGPPLIVMNGLEATTYGGELVLATQITDWWGMKAGYSHLQKFITLKPWSMDTNGGMGEGNDHKHRVVVQSSMDVLTAEVDLFYRFVDNLPNTNAPVPSYSTFDCRLGWHATRNLELSVLFQNIFLPEHVEFGNPTNRKTIGREIFGKISLTI